MESYLIRRLEAIKSQLRTVEFWNGGSMSFTSEGCLVPTQKLYTSSHRMFEDKRGELNIDKK
jgi:hypothetical protein